MAAHVLNAEQLQEVGSELRVISEGMTRQDDEPSAPSSRAGEPSAPSSRAGEPSAPSTRAGEPSAPSSRAGEPSAPIGQEDEPSAPSCPRGQSEVADMNQQEQPKNIQTPSEPCCRIVLRFIDGSDLEYNANASDPVHFLKSHVCATKGAGTQLTESKVRLLFDSRELKRDNTIDECGITDGAVVDVVLMRSLLFRGSQLYDQLVEDHSRSLWEGQEAMDEAFQNQVYNKQCLNDAFAENFRSRKLVFE